MAVSMGAVGDSLTESQDEPEDLFIDEDDCMDIDMDDIRLLDDMDDSEKSETNDGVLSSDSVKSSSARSGVNTLPATTQEPDGTLTLFSENLEESVVIRANKISAEKSTGDNREIFTLSHESTLKETTNSEKAIDTIPSSLLTTSNNVSPVKNLSNLKNMNEHPNVLECRNNVVDQSDVTNDNRREPVSDIHDIKLVAPKRKNMKSPSKGTPPTSKKQEEAAVVTKFKSEPIEYNEPSMGINDITELDIKPFLLQSGIHSKQDQMPALNNWPLNKNIQDIKPLLTVQGGLAPESSGQVSVPSVQPGQIPVTVIQSKQLPVSTVPSQKSSVSGIQPGVPLVLGTQHGSLPAGQLPTLVYQPGSLSPLEPGQLSASAVQPVQLSASAVGMQPGQLPVSALLALQSGQLSTSSTQPGKLSTSAIQHQQLPLSSLEPGQLSASAIQPQQVTSSGISIQPRQSSVLTVQPGHLQTPAIQPGQLSASGIQPNQLSVTGSPTLCSRMTPTNVGNTRQMLMNALKNKQLQVSGNESSQPKKPFSARAIQPAPPAIPVKQPGLVSILQPGIVPVKVVDSPKKQTQIKLPPVVQLGQDPVTAVYVGHFNVPSAQVFQTSQQGVAQPSRNAPSVDRQRSQLLPTIFPVVDGLNKETPVSSPKAGHVPMKSASAQCGPITTASIANITQLSAQTIGKKTVQQVSAVMKNHAKPSEKVSNASESIVKDDETSDHNVSDEEDIVDEPMTENEIMSDEESLSSSSSTQPSASSSIEKDIIKKPISLLQSNVDLNPKVVLKKLQDKDLQLLQKPAADARRNLQMSKLQISESASTNVSLDMNKVTSGERASSSYAHSVVEGNRWQCYACSNEFCSKTDMLYHVQISHSYYTNKGMFSCTHCGKGHSSLEEAISHEKATHSLKLSCCFCGKQQSNMTALQIHVCNHVHPLTYLCMLCREDFSSVQLAEKHITMHKGEVAFWTDFLKCRFCGSLFSKRHRLYHHVLVTHANLFRHKCKSCSQVFYGELALLLHRSDKDHFLDGKKVHVQENVELHFDMSSEKVSQEMIDISDDECDDSSPEKTSLQGNPTNVKKVTRETPQLPSAPQRIHNKDVLPKVVSQVAMTVSQIENKRQSAVKDLQAKPPTAAQKEDGFPKTLEFCFFALLKMSSLARDDLLQQSVSFEGKINNNSHSLLTKVYKQKFHLVSHLKTEMDRIMEVIKKDSVAKNPNDIPSYAKNEKIFLKVFPLLQKQISFDNQDDNTEQLGVIIGEFFDKVKEVLTNPALKVTIEKEHNPVAVEHYKEWTRFLSQLIISHWDCVKNLVMGGLNRDSVAFLPKVSEIRLKKVAILSILESEMGHNNSDSAEVATPAISDKGDNSVPSRSLQSDKEKNSEKSTESSLSSVMSEAEKKADFVSKLNKSQQSDCRFSLAYISKEYLQNSLSLREQLEQNNVSCSPVNTPATSQRNVSVKPAVTVQKPAVTINNPVVTVHRPAVTIHKAAVTLHKPAVTINKPAVKINKPAVTINKPAVTTHKPETEKVTVDLSKDNQSKGRVQVIDLENDKEEDDDDHKDDDDEIVSVNDNDDSDNDTNQDEDGTVSNSKQESKPSESSAEGLLLDCEEESSDTEEENGSPVKQKTGSAKVVVASADTVEEDSDMILDCQCVKIEPNFDEDNVDLTLEDDEEEKSSFNEDKDQKADVDDSVDEQKGSGQGDNGETELDKNEAGSKTLKVIKVETTEGDDVYNITLAEDVTEKELDSSTHIHVKRELTEDITPEMGENGAFPTDQPPPPPHKKLKLVQIFGSDVQTFSEGEMTNPETRNLSNVATDVLPTETRESDEQDTLDTSVLKKFYA